MRRRTGALLLGLTLALLSSCAPKAVEPQAAAPSYAELAQRYNRRIEGLDRLWARAVVAVRWHDTQRDRDRYEQGNDSKLIVDLPDRVALAVGSVGKIAFWAGSDAQRFWLLNLLDEPEAWIGRQAGSARALAEHGLPLQVSPRMLPLLIGLMPLPEAVGTPPAVRVVKGGYELTLPDGRARLTLEADTAHPRRVELLDERGRAVVVSTLSQPQRMTQHGKPPGAWPWIMTRIELQATQEPFLLSLNLEDMTDARAANEQEKAAAFSRSFDFAYLVDKAFKVPPANRHTID